MASLARDSWGLSPRSKRFPITGKGFGPGGRFLGIALRLEIIWKVLIKTQMRQRHIRGLKKSIFLYVSYNLKEERIKKKQNKTSLYIILSNAFCIMNKKTCGSCFAFRFGAIVRVRFESRPFNKIY